MTRALAVVAVALFAIAWATSCRLETALSATIRAEAERDSLAAEAAIQRARAAGWETRFAERAAVADSLMATDSSLAADLRASNVRIESLTRLVSVLRDSITSVGYALEPAVVVDDATSATEAVTDSTHGGGAPVIRGAWGGEFADDLFRGRWEFHLPEIRLGIAIQAECPVSLYSSRSGDGRMVVFARGDDSRCRPHVNELYFAPPPPIIRAPTGLFHGWSGRLIFFGLGFITGEM